MRRTLLTATILVITLAVVAYAQRGGPPIFDQGPGGRGPGPMQQELKIVKQFDKDHDGRLNASERKAAFEYVQSQGVMGSRGGRGPMGFPGRGTTSGSPGRALAPKDVKSFGKTPLYDATAFRTIFLKFDDANWEDELMAFKMTDVEVPATMTVDGT